MMEDAQKKAKRAGMPIANVELVMMASAAVLAAQHFPREVDDWEGLPAVHRTWRAWKVAFRLAHLKRQHQLSCANSILPTPATNIDRLETALDNLTLAAANNTTVQQLKAANLDLVHTTSNATLTAANKKLSEALVKALATTPGMPREIHPTNKPFPGNYCWTHDHRCSQHPASHECDLRRQGRGSPGHSDGFQHDRREQEGQGMEHTLHLMVWDGKFSKL
jgi:hypothetical protein